MVLAESFGLPLEKIRFVCPDVGGGFGLRNNLYPEQAAILWAAKRVGRPVKWTNDRSESFLTDYAGRDLVTTARLALTSDGRITAYQVDHIGTCGGQTVTYVPLSNAYRVATTVYDIPLMHMRCRSVMTNTVPTAPFRGAGRPEATLVLERLIDLAADRLGIDRAAHPPEERHHRSKKLPYRTASGLLYDSGDFAGNMKRMIEAADWKGFAARRRESKRRGKLRGIGISNYRRNAGRHPARARRGHRARPPARSSLRSARNRPARATRRRFAQVMADLLGVHPEDIMFIGGDTAKIAVRQRHAFRPLDAARRHADGRRPRARWWRRPRRWRRRCSTCRRPTINFDDGLFATPNSNRRLTIYDVAQAIDDNPALARRQASCNPRRPSPAASRPIRPAARSARSRSIRTPARSSIPRYGSIDDAGQAINPLILHGQVHGGIVQGVGQALLEDVRYDETAARC